MPQASYRVFFDSLYLKTKTLIQSFVISWKCKININFFRRSWINLRPVMHYFCKLSVYKRQDKRTTFLAVVEINGICDVVPIKSNKCFQLFEQWKCLNLYMYIYEIIQKDITNIIYLWINLKQYLRYYPNLIYKRLLTFQFLMKV